MNRKLIAVLIANLFVAPVALAQSDFKLDGNVGLGGLYSSDSDTKDRAKLEEYQDLSNGAAGYFGLRGRSSTYADRRLWRKHRPRRHVCRLHRRPLQPVQLQRVLELDDAQLRFRPGDA